MYHRGFGVECDYAEAVKWYRKAADQGNILGQSNLGAMYEYGIGVIKNTNKAVYFYHLAAEQGNTDAKAGLKRLGYSE